MDPSGGFSVTKTSRSLGQIRVFSGRNSAGYLSDPRRTIVSRSLDPDSGCNTSVGKLKKEAPGLIAVQPIHTYTNR